MIPELPKELYEMAAKILRVPIDSSKADLAKLEEVSEFKGVYPLLAYGSTAALVVPRPGLDQMTFDRKVCEAGMPYFLRPTFPSEWMLPEDATLLIVEVKPGIRAKLSADYVKYRKDGQHRHESYHRN